MKPLRMISYWLEITSSKLICDAARLLPCTKIDSLERNVMQLILKQEMVFSVKLLDDDGGIVIYVAVSVHSSLMTR